MTNKKVNISIYQMEKASIEYKKSHTVQVSGLTEDEVPGWFKKFHEEEFKPLVEIVARMQNEPPKWFTNFSNYVIEQFKKQEQFNNYVLDVFKRNNLK